MYVRRYAATARAAPYGVGMAFAPIETDRLVLRAMTPGDAEPLAVRRSDPETAMYQAWTIPYPLERARELVASVADMDGPTRGEWFQVAIVESASGAGVGDVAVRLSDNGHLAEVGYTLNPEARGRGFAKEAAAAMIDHLVTVVGVHRLEAETDPRNEASGRVLRRLGFALEGIRREAYLLDGVVSDSAIWGLLARDWRGAQS